MIKVRYNENMANKTSEKQANQKYILALDAGTTSVRSIIYNANAQAIAMHQKEFTQIFPQPSWVEHNAEEIWEAQLCCIKEALRETALSPEEIAVIGIANQRETTVVWDRITGKPIYNAIVWQCRRTDEMCRELKNIPAFEETVRKITGLPIDAYFSATKIRWILDNVKGAKEKAANGELAFGTIDSWLIYNLTKGKRHITDCSNASRTMLYNINTMQWDEVLCGRLGIPMNMLPEVVDSSDVCAHTDASVFGAEIPIGGIAGDQQAALFGQGCFNEGEAKNTYGTGCFLLLNAGNERPHSANGLISTVAWRIAGATTYALEGSVFVGGAVIQWLRDELGLIRSAGESYEYAVSIDNSAGVYIVPAFSGLGAPYWDAEARGMICGLTRAARKEHIVRAALEAIAYQTRDLLDAVQTDAGTSLKELMVDGGACANDFLMQFQADIIGKNVNRPANIESTALGAAYLAGLSAGIFPSFDAIRTVRKVDRLFIPMIGEAERKQKTDGWKRAVAMCRNHSEG